MIVEPFANDDLADNLNPVGRCSTRPPPPCARRHRGPPFTPPIGV